MPRRRAQPAEPIFTDETQLALPPVRTSGHSHGREHHVDEYLPPPGAIPGKAKLTDETLAPKSVFTKQDLADREAARAEMRMAAARWERYLDLLDYYKGNKILSLADVYDMTEQEVRQNIDELLLDVRRGIGSSDIGRIMEKNSLDAASRARIISKHAYSDNAAASLKAVDMASELSRDVDQTKEFEYFVREAKRLGR